MLNLNPPNYVCVASCKQLVLKIASSIVHAQNFCGKPQVTHDNNHKANKITNLNLLHSCDQS